MTANDKIKDIEAEIAEMHTLISDASVPQDEKDFAKSEIVEMEGKIEMIKNSEAAEEKRLIEKKSNMRKQGGKRIKKKAKKQRKITGAKKIRKLNAPKAVKIKAKLPKSVSGFNSGRVAGNLERDRQRLAKKPGKRTSAEGNTYYENRSNRADVNKTHRLFIGGRTNSALAKDRKYFNKRQEHEVRYAKEAGRRKKKYRLEKGGSLYNKGGKVGEKVKFIKGFGYWDLTKYPYGGDFKRFKGDEEGVLIEGTRKLGDEIRVKLDDARVIISGYQAINLPTNEEKHELLKRNEHLFSFGREKGGSVYNKGGSMHKHSESCGCDYK